ncbi:MAG: Hsp20/alpha crystallin family protein [Candidatus Handelsmanbacteria bacterium]|nr:Hsp20/alpha crystallin family protein [Candidatus Handelsmanbacteria bacterium]
MSIQTQALENRTPGTLATRERASVRRVYTPRADVYETPEEIVVVAELPGISEESLDITLEQRELTIRGTRSTAALEGYRLIYSEYGEGNYERRFVLADSIDRAGIAASLKNGVLQLRLPKVKEALARKIPVKAE